MVFPGESFDPGETLRSIARNRCTALHGVPTMFVAMLEHDELARLDLSSLRTGIMAGAPCPIETMRKVIARMHMSQVTIAYGMTETSPISFQSSLDDPLERRVSTVGRIQPHLEVKIVDDAGRIVPVGTAGELCTRGYAVMRGYWKDEARTREAIDAAGWMHTGDLATIDAEGYANIVGRVKDMLIRGGENVYPREVEEYLLRHPGIQDVQVFGVPDAKYGEEVCAWVDRAPRPCARRGSGARLLPRPDRPLQGAALCPDRRCVSAHGDRQGAEVRDAQGDDGVDRAEGRANRLNTTGRDMLLPSKGFTPDASSAFTFRFHRPQSPHPC